MPWNGSGQMVRLYNWTSDANNNIPISASRMDGEADDIYTTGFGNCLTRDSQGIPTSALTWPTSLTIALASDGTGIAVGRTGGTNNPQLQLKVADATGALLNLSTAQQIAVAIAGTTYLALSGTGALSVNAPSARAAIGIATATYTFGNSTDNPNYVFAGSGSITLPGGGFGTGILTVGGLNVNAATLPSNGIYLPSANTLGFATDGVSVGSVSSAGSWSIPTPSSAAAPALSIAAAANAYAEALAGSSTSGESFGLSIKAGTNTSDTALLIQNQAASSTFAQIFGDGEFIIGQPSAATNQGTSAFQVGYLEAPINALSGSYTLAITDRGKFLLASTSGNITIPANSVTPFPVGTTILIRGGGTGTITIGINTDTLVWLPSGSTGTRTLAAISIATLVKVTSTEWYIWGFGLS